MINIILIVSVLASSTLSGIFAMGGGTVLLAILINILPMKAAMIFHGVIQFFSNFFRCLLSWRHIVIPIILFYGIGTLLSTYFLLQLVYEPNKAYVLLSLGLITLVGPYLKFINIDITNKFGAFTCGALIVWLNTLIGVSGPLLNMFFLKSNLNRHQIIATKSLTQTTAHIIKVIFYMGVFDSFKGNTTHLLNNPILPFLAGLTFFGGWLGKKVVQRMSDQNFKAYGSILISIFGLVFIIQGLYLLIQ